MNFQFFVHLSVLGIFDGLCKTSYLTQTTAILLLSVSIRFLHFCKKLKVLSRLRVHKHESNLWDVTIPFLWFPCFVVKRATAVETTDTPYSHTHTHFLHFQYMQGLAIISHPLIMLDHHFLLNFSAFLSQMSFYTHTCSTHTHTEGLGLCCSLMLCLLLMSAVVSVNTEHGKA